MTINATQFVDLLAAGFRCRCGPTGRGNVCIALVQVLQ
jgi:hypothetical protein